MSMAFPKTTHINATEARQSFGDVIKRAVIKGEQFIVEKNDLPVVVILSVRDYEEMRRAAAVDNLRELNRELNKAALAQGLTPEKVEQESEEIKREVYQQLYG